MTESAVRSRRSAGFKTEKRGFERRFTTVNIGEHSRVDHKGRSVKTRPGICHRKKRHAAARDALLAGRDAPFRLTPYRCDLCRAYHLTSRTKGMFVGRKCNTAAR